LQNFRGVIQLRHLFQSWDEVVEQIDQATQILLFLDYDGTLTPIVARPEMAVLSSQTRKILKQISCHSLFKLAIISGRSLSEVKTLLGLENIAYAGNHGLEIECPPHYCQERSPETTTFAHPIAKQFQPRLKTLEQRLKKELRGINGIVIQNKGLTLSVHYRLAEETTVKIIKQLFFEAIECADAKDKLQVTEGKKVLEVRPPIDWNKGKAIEWLLEIYGTPGSLPIFAGDDVTDEDGFEVLHRVGGISIFVGEDNASSAADYYLGSPKQLYHWLGKLLERR
jgi:trehalose 6-phosphate phosphatase